MLSGVSDTAIDDRAVGGAGLVDRDRGTTAEPSVRAGLRLDLNEDDRPRARWERSIGWVIVAVCTFAAIAIIDPHAGVWPPRFGWLFRPTTTNGGDMGAHVWLPWFLEHHWFTKLRLSGWAPDWYAGFPVGQYYFPFPSLMVAFLDLFMPYTVAFKLVTVSGVVALPAAAYSFAKGMRTPWPAPPAFAIAALGMLVETRTSWNIYGGNIASTLAGEYSFEIALALALFGLGALAYSLDTGRRTWLAAVLIAAAIMSHIVVAIFVGVAATLMWLVRSPRRSWPIAVAVGAVGLGLTAVWSLPLVGQQAYTQSMRYGKVISGGSTWQLPYWVFLPNPVKHAIEGIVRGVAVNRDANGKITAPTLWLPWWMWLLAGIAIIAAGWYRRRSTLVLLLIALAFGVFFVQWPQHAVWNTRFLPFWLLTWGFLAAMGATETVRLLAMGAARAFTWVREGDLQDARARAWADVARDETGSDPRVRQAAVEILADRRFDTGPPGWEPDPRLDPARLARLTRLITAIALAVLLAAGGAFAMHRAYGARDNNPGQVIAGWADWNYGGYEAKGKAWTEFRGLISTMNSLPPGRALWEGGDAVGAYGTPLAPELLPYFTHGRIDSMEGLYFESSATTSFHFLTVSELTQNPSDPVSGLNYGHADNAGDFALGVKHLQMLGVSYLMLFTEQTERLAAQQPDLRLIRTVPDVDGQAPKGWKIYQVVYPAGQSPLVTGLSYEPVVAKVHGGTYQQCWGQPWTGGNPVPTLEPWECSAAPWFMDPTQLDKVWVASGPKSWKHIDIKQLASTTEPPIVPTSVTNVHESVDTISFHVSDIGKPVLVKTSYFPNWQAHGAHGPYRVAPNLMVVVPTGHDVKLTYGLTPIDWMGRAITVLALVGLALLLVGRGLRRFGASRDDDETGSDDASPEHDIEDSGGIAEAPAQPGPVRAGLGIDAAKPRTDPD